MSRLLRALCRRSSGRPGDAGAATVFVVAMAVVLLVSAGLVIDGGQAINARARVADDAEQAARAGADRIDVDELRSSGTVRIDPGPAAGSAADFLAVRGYGAGQYGIAVQEQQVTVTVRDTVPTAFVLLVGISRFDVEATATAEAATGALP